MARYVEGRSRSQNFLLPESVDDYVDENNPVRVVEVFVDTHWTWPNSALAGPFRQRRVGPPITRRPC